MLTQHNTGCGNLYFIFINRLADADSFKRYVDSILDAIQRSGAGEWTLSALDGGRVFLLLVTWVIERITKKRLDPKYEGYIHAAGMVLLLALMAYIMFNDIVRIVTK